jgi:hypothetical protein
MNGSRITVQFARGARHKENFSGPADRAAPRPRRTIYRMVIEGLASETSWQDLKDFARDGASVDVVYSETDRARDGKGFVEFETKEDLQAAVGKLDGRDYKGGPVTCREDVCCKHHARGTYADRLHRSRMSVQTSIVTIVSAHHPLAVATHQQTDTIVLHHVNTVAIVSDLRDRHAAATMTILQETTEAEHLPQEIHTDRHREIPTEMHTANPSRQERIHRSRTRQITLGPEAHPVLITTIVVAMEEDTLIVDTE